MKNRLKLFLCFITALFITFTFSQNVHGGDLLSESCINLPQVNDQGTGEKVIYLTFDDGPSVTTNKILDILKEKNVKATFFLIGNQIDGFEDTVKRMAKEGHSTGLHTYSHKYKRVYRSNDAFIKEMLDCRTRINKVTETNPNIVRFPGGSRKRLNNEFLDKLHKNNFKIYDWNVQVSDGINPKTSSYKLFKEATNCKDIVPPIILLMHCDYMHKTTCQALPSIIEYYKQQGYVFKAITEDTPELYFPPSKKAFKSFWDIMTSK